VGGAKGL